MNAPMPQQERHAYMVANTSSCSEEVLDADVLEHKIRKAPGFLPLERELILRALNLGARPTSHLYPAGHSPTSSVYAGIAWDILDSIAPDTLTIRDRFMLGAMITNTLRDVHRQRTIT